MKASFVMLTVGLGLLAGCSHSSYEIPEGVRPLVLPELSKLDAVAQSKITDACHSLFQIQSGEQELPAQIGELATKYATVGQLLHAYSFLDQAAICYRNAILLDPDNNLSWNYLLSQIYLTTNEKATAIKHLKESERVYLLLERKTPDLLHAIYYYMGDAYLSLNQPEKAKQAFEKALRSRNSAIVHWSLGKLALPTDPDASIEHLQNALKLNPNARNIHYSLMMAYSKIGNQRQAQLHKTAFEQSVMELTIPDKLMQSVENLRDTPAALRAQGDAALFLSGDYPTAIKLYTSALKNNPQDPSLHLNLGLAKFRMGLFEAATTHFNDTLAIDPEHSRAMTGLGLIALSKGDMPSALLHLQRAVEIEPNSREIRQTYVNTLLENNDPAAAIIHLQYIVNLFPADQQAMTLLIYCQLADQQFENALRQLETALKLFPEDLSVAYYGVYALTAGGEDQRDISRATTLANKLGTNVRIVAEGYLLAGQGMYAEAASSEQRLETPHNLDRYSESMLPQIINYDEL
ncbi:MAG: tetratricopeptide repeat protein [Planctomycetota bacterium]|nr:tetratricopeptide repeat protein [Planctomycetota bacterium]